MANSLFAEVKKLLTEQDVEITQPYMVNRILSFAPEACLQTHELNRFVGRLPTWATDPLFNLVIPKNARRGFFRYARKKKKYEPKLIAKICETYCVNEYHAKQIIEVLRRQNKKPESFYGLKKGV